MATRPVRRLAITAALAAALAPGAAGAAETGSRTEVELGASHESLTNNRGDWRSTYVEAAHDFRRHHTLYGGVRETRRFGADDNEAHVGLYYPIARDWISVVELRASESHNVLPKYSLWGQLERRLAGGWGVGAGLRRSEYTATHVDIVTLLADRYWGNFRGAYTLYNGRPDNASSASAHRFQLSYYYGERSSVGLSYTTGREVENVGPPLGVVSSDIRDWTLSGRHWFARGWAVTYDLLTHEQGSLYRREGLRIGIRHSF